MAPPLPILAKNGNPTFRSRPPKRTGYHNEPDTLREADANKVESQSDLEVICSIQLMSLWSSKRPANIQLWYKSREKPRTQNPDRLPLSLQTKKTHEVTTP
ncbi:hypothetical protein BM1_05478 [Bipolaris maydis]|nr:hypothetical protein BM1_05478 [Bipolaris maydis]